MGRYIRKRILMLIPVIIGVSFLIYFIMDLAPGDVISQLAPDNATTEQIEMLRHQYGYDRSVFYRYMMYMAGLVKGDLGTSYLTGKPVWEMFIQRLPATLALSLGAIIVSMIISIPLGVFSAIHNGSLGDNAAMVVALLGLSMPNFWLGLLLIIAFSLQLGLFPSGGMDGIRSVILPAITIGTGYTAIMTRTTRSSMLDVIRQDYLRTARAKGVPEKVVIRKHALKNALIPIITVIGTQMAACIGGSVLTETVFAWPGVGRLIIDSVNQRDVPAVTGSIIMTTILISILLLVIDLLYAFVDPRIKAQYAKRGK
ncbi:MAG: ABC transporter permease [Lachnospiraceae bacterium]|nr:ABC transporter permease [Lachnospiraceae bacterium]